MLEPDNKTAETVKARTASRRKADLMSAIIELLKVKTLITLAVTAGCVWGFLHDKISVEMFGSIVTMVLTNYFRKGKDE